MSSPSASTSSGAGAATAEPASAEPLRIASLPVTLALAFVPLCLIVVTGLWLVLLDAEAVRTDLRRMFEELREVALVRAVVDELRGIEQWIDALPEARAATHELVLADVGHHLQAARATLQRFHVADDPSAPPHTAEELPLLARIEQSLHTIQAGARSGEAIGSLAEPLRTALHGATVLAYEVESESRTIGADLDQRSADLSRFMVLIGAASAATIAALGWLLHRRVLLPVRDLRRGAEALARGTLVRVPNQRADELGELARAFTAMATQLHDSRRDLERRVEERSREVVRTARLAQLGTLAAGIAHEINNPLASIVACAEGLLRDRDGPDDTPPAREYLQILHQEALRARDITARLLRFAHQGEPRHDVVWLGAEVHDVAPMFHHQLGDAGVRLTLDVPAREPAIVGDAAEWRQVLYNLLRNALDASPRGASIEVGASAAHGRVQLTVRDHGPGIPEAHRERVFEPFFTTKPPGQGTGLGLAIVHRIVTAHRGTVAIEAAAGGGTLVRIELPAAPGPLSSPSPP
jgi:signal transduction histidine kinase